MIYYIYKITLTKGKFKGHYYIGQHKTNDINDGYKGSGRYVRDYYKKHPNDYIKEIICYCDNADDLNEKEAYYVGDLYKTDDMCLNLRAGGDQQGFSDEHIRNLSEAMKGRTPWNKGKKTCITPWNKGKKTGKPAWNKGKKYSDESRQKMSESHKGKPLSDETRKKQSESHTGKKWYNNGITETLAFKCPDGYVSGRLKVKPSCNKGKQWYNNGTTQIRAFECPDGYVTGMLKTKA